MAPICSSAAASGVHSWLLLRCWPQDPPEIASGGLAGTIIRAVTGRPGNFLAYSLCPRPFPRDGGVPAPASCSAEFPTGGPVDRPWLPASFAVQCVRGRHAAGPVPWWSPRVASALSERRQAGVTLLCTASPSRRRYRAELPIFTEAVHVRSSSLIHSSSSHTGTEGTGTQCHG